MDRALVKVTANKDSDSASKSATDVVVDGTTLTVESRAGEGCDAQKSIQIPMVHDVKVEST